VLGLFLFFVGWRLWFVFLVLCLLAGWLVGFLLFLVGVVWLVGWLGGLFSSLSLGCRLFGLFLWFAVVCFLVGWLVGWFVYFFAAWFVGCSVRWFWSPVESPFVRPVGFSVALSLESPSMSSHPFSRWSLSSRALTSFHFIRTRPIGSP
jgi:hypothetical protein